MKRYIRLTYIFLAGVLGIVMPGCADDFPGYGDGDFLEGETTVTLEASFSPFAEGDLTRASLTPPGRGMNVLNDLCILVYDKSGELIDGFPKNIEFSQDDVKDENRKPGDASNDKAPAETDSKSLKDISLKLPFGEYYIIGVANLGSYSTTGTESSTYAALTGMGKYADQISTLDGLRSLKVTWDKTNYRNNCEMLGYFTSPEEQSPRYSSGFPTVKVNRPGLNLRAWLRRCASKITIDFDGSNLRDNVYVYIKDARIYDMAKECTLGFGVAGEVNYNNKVNTEDGLISRNRNESVHFIEYGEGDDYHGWPFLTKGTPKIEGSEHFHDQDAAALYFYENMQGDAPNGKIPVADLENGGVMDADIKKDGVEYGTYIEVTAHYHSDADGNIADGDIKYRFMIGKDVAKSCDAERNYHYKLTLKPRGNGNDADWHIDFDEPEGFDVPNPWYVSYLYNHDAQMPFKYTPKEGYEVVKIVAEIETNPWYPSTLPAGKETDPDAEITITPPLGDDPSAYTNTANRSNGNGFLSLRATSRVVIKDTDATGGKTWNNNGGYTGTANDKINDNYYYGKGVDNIDRSKREFDLEKYKYNPDDREAYTFQKIGDKVSMSIPLFTRAKVMVKQTGYSGNNPFVGYQRTAKLKLTPYVRKKNTTDEPEPGTPAKVNVIQVRRVVNPKGVYRRSGNNEPFHVQMMWLENDEIDYFTPAISHGPWKAEIIGDANFITLDGKQSVSGATETYIDFTIRFNKANVGNGVHNAVVRILYHNYTCTHLIFVRQGYAPQAIVESGVDFDHPNGDATPTVWQTCNMISENRRATDPRDEGSLFKYGNASQPIDARNNAYTTGGKEYYKIPENQSDFVPQGPFVIAKDKVGDDGVETESDKKAWNSINTKKDGSGADKKDFSVYSGKINKTATIRDFEQLYLSENVQFGYGVLYADGATETQVSVSNAYGYRRWDTPSGDSEKGMRGMFAYYWNRNNPKEKCTARNIFFPIGRSGFGHRKNENEGDNNGKGMLRYSCVRYRPSTQDTYSQWGKPAGPEFPHNAPLFVSIYRRPGAIYWGRSTVDDHQYLPWNGDKNSTEGVAYGLDINYFSLDVNAITAGNISHGADACFVRCVGYD